MYHFLADRYSLTGSFAVEFGKDTTSPDAGAIQRQIPVKVSILLFISSTH
jgi:hypothetical protein